MYVEDKIKNLFAINKSTELKRYCLSLLPQLGEWSHREDKHGVHKFTQSVPFTYLPNGEIPIEENVQVVGDIDNVIGETIKDLERYFNGFVTKSLLISLKAGHSIDRHADFGVDLTEVHRCHIPIQTNKEVAFFVRDTWYHLREGYAYEISNVDEHAVVNDSDIDRIHLIIDIKEYDEQGS